MLTQEIIESIKSSVLCWLATVSDEGVPNVSPKEAFLCDEGRILIAHIASPKSVLNIHRNPNVCVSFIDVFTQRGFKVIGSAEVVSSEDDKFESYAKRLMKLVGTSHKVLAVFVVTPSMVEEIIAPSYKIRPETKIVDMVEQSLETYRVRDYQEMLELGSQGR